MDEILEISQLIAFSNSATLFSVPKFSRVETNVVSSVYKMKSNFDDALSVCEKFQTTRAKVAPVNLIYGSHFSATEATYKVSLKMVNFVEFTRTSTRIRRKPVPVLINVKYIYIIMINCVYIFPSLNSNQLLFIFYESH